MNTRKHFTCTICGEKHYAKGLCSNHYELLRKYGKPEYKKERYGEQKAYKKEHSTWVSMISRCYNIQDVNYKNYGGRGISVCDEWKENFWKFLKDMGIKPFPKAQIDRIDNNGNYEPSNCKWVHHIINGQHKRNTKLNPQKAKEIKQMIEDGYDNKTIAKKYGVADTTICNIKSGHTWFNVYLD